MAEDEHGFLNLRAVDSVDNLPAPPAIDKQSGTAVKYGNVRMYFVMGPPPKIAISTGTGWAVFEAKEVISR